MHLISASRRTDLPALYAEWFLRRIRSGQASWVHPYTGELQTVSLAPPDVAAIVFWTRNFYPMMRHLDELERRGYRYLVQFTVTGLPRKLETHVPAPGVAVSQMRRLAERVGPERVLWRYDPILLTPEHDFDFHLQTFDRLSQELEGSTRQCILSFLQVYGKVRRSFESRELDPPLPTGAERRELASRLGEMAQARGIRVNACCSDDLVGPGVGKARCIDLRQVLRLWPGLDCTEGFAPTRKQCGCFRSYDVGAYDTCVQGCIYCYATRDREVARHRYRRHSPTSPTLLPRE